MPRPALRSRSSSGRIACCTSISTASYADVMERALYNGALSGLSREGTHYFYVNPLESRGQHRRWAWHACPCCTMNVSRLVASVERLLSVDAARTASPSTSMAAFEATVTLGGVRRSPCARPATILGPATIRIAVDPESAGGLRSEAAHSRLGEGRDALRSMASRSRSRPHARLCDDPSDSGAPGDVVALDLPMPAERLYAHPNVRMDVGRVALRRGPLIYCVEEADNPGGAVQTLRCRARAPIEAEWRERSVRRRDDA